MDCIFCQIVKGEKKAHRIYGDKKFLAFLDNRPLTRGNTLVIPKKHYVWVDDVPEFGQFFELAKKVGLAAKKALDAEWISYLTIGHEISHAHIRVLPRYLNDGHSALPDLNKIKTYSEEEMKAIASLLTKALK